MQRGHIPANLHFENPNPHIPFENLRLKVVDTPTDWPSVQRPRRAGVSSFGFGGTNAHVVLEQGPELAPSMVNNGSAIVTLVVAGKTAQRVESMAGVLADWLAGEGAEVAAGRCGPHPQPSPHPAQATFATVCARDRDQPSPDCAPSPPARQPMGWCHRIGVRVGLGRCLSIRVRVRSGRGWAGSCWPTSRPSLRRSPSWSRFSLSRSGFRCSRYSSTASR